MDVLSAPAILVGLSVKSGGLDVIILTLQPTYLT